MKKWTSNLKQGLTLLLVCCLVIANPLVSVAMTTTGPDEIVEGDETSQDSLANSMGYANRDEMLDGLKMMMMSETPKLASGGIIPVKPENGHYATPTQIIGTVPSGGYTLLVETRKDTIEIERAQSLEAAVIDVKVQPGQDQPIYTVDIDPITITVQNPEGFDASKTIIVQDIEGQHPERIESSFDGDETTFTVESLGRYKLFEWEGSLPWEGTDKIDKTGGFYRSERKLNVVLDGWDDSFKGDLPAGCTEPFTITFNNDKKLYTITCNIEGEELWQKIYNGTNTSDGLKLRIYPDSPDSSNVNRFYCRPLGDSCFVEDSWITEEGVLNEVKSFEPQNVYEYGMNMIEEQCTIRDMASTLAQDGNKVTIGLNDFSQGMIAYAWYTKDDKMYNFGSEEDRKVVETFDVELKYRGQPAYTFEVRSRVDDSFVKPASSSMVMYTTYDSGKLNYYIDRDKAQTALDNKTLKDLVTTVSLPSGATNISAYGGNISGTDVTFNTGLTVIDGGKEILDVDVYDEYWISYSIGSEDFSQYLVIGVAFVGGNPFDKHGFSPVSVDRIVMNPSLKDATKGFIVYDESDSVKTLAPGELATCWTGYKVDLSEMTSVIRIIAPDKPTGTELVGVKFEPSTGKPLYNYTEREIEDKKDLLESRSFSETEVYDDRISVIEEYEYLPRPRSLGNDIYTYQINGASNPDDATMILLDWVYRNTSTDEEEHKYEYIFGTTQDDHTELFLDEALHKGPNASYVSSSGDKYIVDVRYLPTSEMGGEGGYDVYDIEAINKATGHEIVASGDKVTVRFDYPEGYDKARAETEGLVLTHFNDDFGAIERISGSRINYSDGYFTVDLTSFSPFMLKWGGSTMPPAEEPKISAAIDNPTPKQKEVLKELQENVMAKETDNSLPSAINVSKLCSDNQINTEDVVDAKSSLSMSIKVIDIKGDSPEKMVFEIHPSLELQLKNFATKQIDHLPNSYLNGGAINFRIPIPSSNTKKFALVNHEKSSGATVQYTCMVQEFIGEKYIELSVTEFSNFVVTFSDTDPGKKDPEPEIKPSSRTSSSGSTSSAKAATFSKFWYQDADGTWHIKNGKGEMIKSAWVCDDAVSANSINVWYLIDDKGKMIANGLVQDATGNFYSLETNHNGYFGSLRYKNGYYDCNGQQVYLEFEQNHNGSFGAIKNKEGIEKLKAIYGVTTFGINNSNCVYSSKF